MPKPTQRAQCTLRLDGDLISLGYETTFDDIGTDNEASLTVLGSANNVAAGAHTATLTVPRLTAL